jgi:hypothetical protein
MSYTRSIELMRSQAYDGGSGLHRRKAYAGAENDKKDEPI